MPIKSVQKNQSLNFRMAARQLFRPQGLGILYSQNKERTYQQLLNKYNQSLTFDSGPTPEEIRKTELYNKASAGSLSYWEFKEIAQPLLPTGYSPDILDHITRVEYYNYIESFRPLSKNELLTRASERSSVNSLLKRFEKSKMSREDRINLRASSAARKEQISQLNKQGYFVSEKGLAYRPREGPIFPGLNFTPNIMFSPDIRYSPDISSRLSGKKRK